MDLRATLEAELHSRRKRNPRYSLRAFARALRTHHSTLSQILASRRRLTPRTIRSLGERMGLTPSQVREACIAEDCAAIRRFVADTRFRANSRWIAIMTGIPLDDVNVALHRLLYNREVTMAKAGTWILRAP